MIITINPLSALNLLSQFEVDRLQHSASGERYRLFRNCALAVLNSGNQTEDGRTLLARYPDFAIHVVRCERGVKLELVSPPQQALVDGQLIRTIQENLFAVLRDILFVQDQFVPQQLEAPSAHSHPSEPEQITNLVFAILRNAGALAVGEPPNLVVCWGGHAISQREYRYAQQVGHELGLRKLNICTGCGTGAMEAPMKGAALGHAKQRYRQGRFMGLTEPSIIGAEPPNAIVNQLVIMPDIEKRLEAFVRVAHGIVIFPGGVGTAEELLYLLGILMHPENQQHPLPLILTGPSEAAPYWHEMERFICQTLGAEACRYYQLVIEDAAAVARQLKQGMSTVRAHRESKGDAYSFNWTLAVPPALQHPFEPSHHNMAQLALHSHQPVSQRAVTLRQVFSGIVAGNIRAASVRAVAQQGPFQLQGEPQLMLAIDRLLNSFIEQQRMQLPGATYVPCYQIAS